MGRLGSMQVLFRTTFEKYIMHVEGGCSRKVQRQASAAQGRLAAMGKDMSAENS